MLVVRLAKYGSSQAPTFRVIVVEKKRKREGKSLDILGYWHPKKNEKKINMDKLDYWIKQGAQPSNIVKKLISE